MKAAGRSFGGTIGVRKTKRLSKVNVDESCLATNEEVATANSLRSDDGANIEASEVTLEISTISAQSPGGQQGRGRGPSFTIGTVDDPVPPAKFTSVKALHS